MEELKIRPMEYRDRPQVKALWDTCFHDDPAFTDWFFTHRFAPYYSTVAVLGEQVVSAMQSWPVHLLIRGAIVPSAIVAGVSTDPRHGGKGYMGKLFRWYMEDMRRKGIVCVPHTPANLPTFFSRGHFPTTLTTYVTLTDEIAPIACESVDPSACFDRLYAAYMRFASRFSGIVSRSMADMEKKMDDYASAGGRCVMLEDGDLIKGYCVYFPGDDMVYGEEFVADTDADALTLLCMLRYAAGEKPIKTKFPPDLKPPVSAFETKPQGVTGVADVGTLLRMVMPRIPSVAIEVTDTSLAANGGVYDTYGERCDESPSITVSAGVLTQLLIGFLSPQEAREQDLLCVHDEAAFSAFADALPKCTCHIIDEY